MSTKKLIAAVVAFAAAGSTFAAQTYPYVDFSGFQSTKTRAEVAAELKNARADGDYVVGGAAIADPTANFKSSKARAQVAEELRQAQADGSYARLHQEVDRQFPAASAADSRLARNGKATNLN